MTNGKIYIGSGKATKFDGVMVTLDLEAALKEAYTTDKGRFLTFLVAPRKGADQYGKTHSAMVLPRNQANPSVVAEPTGNLLETPVGETKEVKGRKLKRISPEEAAARKAAKAK